ncbi:hypothetical protein DSCO28_23010 [Desulfosarcina ovata subsp. sediminis]|uniref:KAP NTPase domain-containing protein n=1 Tax=Desulfosarcina ovata subsp. sediminis TaxID=885957 RepID=A0A5K7ZMU0_9BACT|nr:P-loop NTPase fold protein [Desulfosarcina ovata]BBO81735.1 hypothetical protein DSCO28_23010 [Desulfosarcina ovata subsp. sediminis]
MGKSTDQYLNRLICDTPIKSKEDDQLEFNAYAKVLARSMINSSEPLTIGVFAGWGAGKTSLMNLMKQKLEDITNNSKHNSDIVTVWFNSWKYEGENRPIISMCAAIISQLRSVNNNGNQFKNLISSLKHIVHSITIKSKINLTNFFSLEADMSLDKLKQHSFELIDALLEDSLYHKTYEALEHVIHDYDNLKIIVFIDDLDRCSPTRAINLMEDIKLIFNQPNFGFVFGLDKRTVSSYLNKKYDFDESMGNAYLDKLFQVSFNIPDYSRHIQGYAINLIDSYLGFSTINEFKPIFPIIADLCENNPRTVKRLLNNIIIDNQIQAMDTERIPIHYFGYARALQMNDKWRIVSEAIKHDAESIRKKLSEDVYRKGETNKQVREVLHKFSDDKDTLLGPIFRKINMDQNLFSILISNPAKEWLKSKYHENCWVILKNRHTEKNCEINSEKQIVKEKIGKIIDTDDVYKYFPILSNVNISEQIRNLATELQYNDIKEKCEITYWEKVNWSYFNGTVGKIIGIINIQGISICLMSFEHKQELLYMFIASSGIEML